MRSEHAPVSRRGHGGIALARAAWYQRAVRSPLRLVSAALALAGTLFFASSAGAAPSAWTTISGGALGWKQGSTAPDFRADGALVFDIGVGTSPTLPVIVGGVFRITPLLAESTGADMAWLARVCTRGFQAGGFGLAADVGVYARTWGTPSQGFAGSLSLGAPLGITLSFHAMAGSDDLLAFGGTLGIDLLRLTLYRETLLNWWPNPEVETRKLPQAAAGPAGFRF